MNNYGIEETTFQVKIIVENRTGDNIASLVERQLEQYPVKLDYIMGEEYLNGAMIYLTVSQFTRPSETFFNNLVKPFPEHNVKVRRFLPNNLVIIKLAKNVKDVLASDAVHSQAKRLFGNN